MSKKTKFNLLAGVGAAILILFVIFGPPRLSINFGSQPAQAQVIPPGCVAMPKAIVGGGQTSQVMSSIAEACVASVPTDYSVGCTAGWGNVNCTAGQRTCPAGSNLYVTGTPGAWYSGGNAIWYCRLYFLCVTN